ncbi:2-(5''-triphosphoribosyl)-3'-dephosphocoenzyme-A synthase [bacterium HR40]|nr:2-(5''-triphosphoribosyl)-3'-dephosphocoenzyme-A synthase [bacterium HR40]
MQGGESRSAVAAAAFLAACRLELAAPKPGNVHRFAAGHGMTVADFEASALAAAPAIAAGQPGVGLRILAAVEATRRRVGQNTNLGILLLCAPLAEAFVIEGALPDLERATQEVLARLDRTEASHAFQAIRLASPGGLGRVARHDVAAEPEVSLVEAMREAAGRDRIAWNFAHGFFDIFRRGLPWWREAQRSGREATWACAQVYLHFLATVPDTHIARKHGHAMAETVRREARPLCRRLRQARKPDQLLDQLLAFDAALKEKGLNPGTSADLTVATIFASLLEDAGGVRPA